MMRVLFVTGRLGLGGAERQLALLAASLPSSHSATVFSLEGGLFCDALRDLGVPVEVLARRYRFDVAPAVRMWRAAGAIGPDVVHSWSWMTTLAMVPFCRRAGVPLVDATIQHGRRFTANRLGMALADGVVANSRAGMVAYGISEARGRVVYPGLDMSRLASIPHRTQPSRFPALTTVVMTGRMYPEKDWPMLFRAARTLATADNGRWRFIAIGSGPDRDRLMREAADLVSGGVLEFPASGINVLSDQRLLEIVASADMGVLLTDTRVAAEGCSNSIMEYMACGLPVVCTDCGGNPELVEEGTTGYLIPPSDDEMLVTRLRELRDDPVRARSMGDAGARRVAEAFTVQVMVEAYVSVYDWVCNRQVRWTR